MATSRRFLACFLLSCVAFQAVAAAMNGEVVVYWGQGPGSEKALKAYCQDSTYDILVLAFLHDWPTSEGDSQYPAVDMAYCDGKYSKAHPNLLNCPDVADDIQYCQSRGKKVFLSMGGSGGDYGFSSDSQASNFATLVYQTFLGGMGSIRPFGNAVFNGIDLDVEHGSTAGYAAFVNKLRSYSTASQPILISGAPQCPYPDDWLGPGRGFALTDAWFDYVWVQFYNNKCGLDRGTKFNFDTWANWAQTESKNPNVKVLIGAPSSLDSAGTGYVDAATLKTISTTVYNKYPSIFGGVMLWEAGRAERNNNFGAQVAAFVHAGAGSKPASSSSTSTSTSGKSSTSTSTSGKSSTSTSTSGKSSTSSSSSSSSSSGKTPASSPVETPSGSCTSGNMKCAGSTQYQTCTHGAWAQPQSCQSGLKCEPSGNYIYCIRP